MRFLAKLFAFACALTAAILILGLNKRGERERERDIVHRIASSEAPHVARAVQVAPMARAKELAAFPELARRPEEVRILTRNGAAFMSLRGDQVVAGLSDSLREVVAMEMKREMPKDGSGLGGMISEAVRSGIAKLLDKEIAVPVSEIRDIEYRGNRIVIVYKDPKHKPLLNFDTIENDNEALLEQFREEDARRLVDAVRVKIVTR
jgi:hypothetical protein